MLFYEGYSCPVCGKLFTQADDIVVCPTCGAPHHRACWKQEGHCHFEDTHGTAQQWSRETGKTVKAPQTVIRGNYCPYCGQQNPEFSEFCSRCGKSLGKKEWGQESTPPAPSVERTNPYREYRPYQAPVAPAIADDEDIDGVTAAELRCFVERNEKYYLPRFKELFQKGKTVSWNLAAFLISPFWLWFRKQYLAGTAVLVFQIFRTMIQTFFLYKYIGISAFSEEVDPAWLAEQFVSNSTFALWIGVVAVLGILDILIRLFFGLTGNYWYFKTAKKRILKYRDNGGMAAIAQVGGTSVALAIVAYVILYLVSTFSQFLFM